MSLIDKKLIQISFRRNSFPISANGSSSLTDNEEAEISGAF